mgnify:CR=1 FL=1
MANGRHKTTKSPTDPTYSKEWSGVSYTPHCPSGCVCPACDQRLHLEGHSAHYCPVCDDFKSPSANCKNL